MSTVLMVGILFGGMVAWALLFAWILSEAGPPEWHLFRRPENDETPAHPEG